MDRRTALQSLISIIGAIMTEQVPPRQFSIRTPEGLKSLSIHLGWKTIDVHHKGEVVSIDQDELFAALKSSQTASAKGE
jgi:hypothetical protein